MKKVLLVFRTRPEAIKMAPHVLVLQEHCEVNFIYYVHLNHNVQKPASELLSSINKIYLIASLDNETFVFLISKIYLTLTDFRVIKEEVISLRAELIICNTSEKQRVFETSTVNLVDTNPIIIVDEVNNPLENKALYESIIQANNLYSNKKSY